MIRNSAAFASLLLLGACNVTDNGNGTSTVSVDQNKIEQGTDIIANEADKAGVEAVNALQNAGPELKQTASDIKERAGRVADKVDNVDVKVDLNSADTKPAPAKN